jgi:biotin carboxylase
LKKNKLAILGASYLQLPLVIKAQEMGVETHCFAWDNELAICKDKSDLFYDISVLEKELILKKCISIGINGITTIATDICVPTVSYVAEAMSLIGNSILSAKCSTNKALMRNTFLEHHIPSPQFIKYNQEDELLLDGFDYPLIVKPTDRSGSLGVSKVINKEELLDAIEVATQSSIENAVIIEEYIEGTEVSVEFISWNAKHYFLAITDKVTSGAPHFVELAHHQPSSHSFEIQELLKETTIKALNSLDIRYGASHTELKICSDGSVRVIEVGARMGGDFIGSHLVQLSTGYDFLGGVVSCALGDFKNKPEIIEKKYAGVYFLCSETNAILPYFHSNNKFDIEKKIMNSNLVSVESSNDRSGYLIYADENPILLL